MKPSICRHCGKEFQPTDNHYRRKLAKFCSPKCWYESQRKPMKCKGCGKEMPHQAVFRNRYCSHACRVEHHGFRARIRKPKKCATCGAEFLNNNGRFCSWKCYSATVARTRKPPRTLYAERSWKKRAAKIRKRDGYICQGCGVPVEARGLAVDHLVPYRIAKRLADLNPSLDPNAPINLMSLCGSCHATKTTYEEPARRGDLVKFFGWAALVVGKQPLRDALEYFGLWDQMIRRTA